MSNRGKHFMSFRSKKRQPRTRDEMSAAKSNDITNVGAFETVSKADF